jgi:hypothetical protein
MLDRLRADFGVGKDVHLFMLKMGRTGGFEQIVEVEDGWTLEDAPPGQPLTLVIVERPELCTYDMLITAKHFSINGELYDLAGTYNFTGITQGSSLREWLFPISPTGQSWP